MHVTTLAVNSTPHISSIASTKTSPTERFAGTQHSKPLLNSSRSASSGSVDNRKSKSMPAIPALDLADHSPLSLSHIQSNNHVDSITAADPDKNIHLGSDVPESRSAADGNIVGDISTSQHDDLAHELREHVYELSVRLRESQIQCDSFRSKSLEEEERAREMANRLQTALALAEATRAESSRDEHGRSFIELQLRELDAAYQDSCSQVLNLQEECVTLKLHQSKLSNQLQTSQTELASLQAQLAQARLQSDVGNEVVSMTHRLRDLQAEMAAMQSQAKLEVDNLKEFAQSEAAARQKLERVNSDLAHELERCRFSLKESHSAIGEHEATINSLSVELRREQAQRHAAAEAHALFISSRAALERTHEQALQQEHALHMEAIEATRTAQAAILSEKQSWALRLQQERKEAADSEREIRTIMQRRLEQLQAEVVAAQSSAAEAHDALARNQTTNSAVSEEHRQQAQLLQRRHDSVIESIQKRVEGLELALIQKESIIKQQSLTLEQKDVQMQAQVESLRAEMLEQSAVAAQIRSQAEGALEQAQAGLNSERNALSALLEAERKARKTEAEHAANEFMQATSAREALQQQLGILEQTLHARGKQFAEEIEAERKARKADADQAALEIACSTAVQNQLRDQLSRQEQSLEVIKRSLESAKTEASAAKARATQAEEQMRVALAESAATMTRTNAEQLSAHADTLGAAAAAHEVALRDQAAHFIALRQSAEEALITKHVRLIDNLSAMHMQEKARRDAADQTSQKAFEAAVNEARNTADAAAKEVAELSAALALARREHESTLRRIQQEHAQLQKEHELIFATQLTAETDRLNELHAKEVHALSEELRETRESLNAKKTKIQWHIDDHSAEIARLSEEADSAAAAAATELKSARSAHESDVRMLRLQLEQAQGTLKAALKAQEDQAQALITQQAQLQNDLQKQHHAELARQQSRLTAAEDRIAAVRERLESEAQAEKARAISFLESVRAEHAAELALRQDTHNRALQARETALAQAREGASLDRQSHQREIARLQHELAEAETRRRAEVLDAQSAAEDARKLARTQLSDEIQRHRAELLDAVATKEEALARLEAHHREVLHEVREECRNKFEAQVKQLESEQYSMKALHRSECDDLKACIQAAKMEREESFRILRAEKDSAEKAHALELHQLQESLQQIHMTELARCKDHSTHQIAGLIAEHESVLALQDQKASTALFSAEQAALQRESILTKQLEERDIIIQAEHRRVFDIEISAQAVAKETSLLRDALSKQQQVYSELLSQYDRANLQNQEYCTQLDAQTVAQSALLAEMDALKQSNQEYEESLKLANAEQEKLRNSYATQVGHTKPEVQILSSNNRRDENVLRPGAEEPLERIAAEALLQRLASQDRIHARAIEEHVSIEEMLWKQKEAHTRISVEAEMALSQARTQLSAAQLEVKELTLLHKMAGDDIVTLQTERSKLLAGMRALELRCASAEAASKVADEASILMQVRLTEVQRLHAEALQRKDEETHSARSTHDAQVLDLQNTAERVAKLHSQQLIGLKRKLQDAQNELKQLASELVIERARVADADTLRESLREKHSSKLLEAQRREVILQQRLEDAYIKAADATSLREKLDIALQHLRDKDREQQESMEVFKQKLAESSCQTAEMKLNYESAHSQSQNFAQEIATMRRTLEDNGRNEARLVSALHDAESSVQRLQHMLDQQREARIAQEVQIAKLQKHLQRARAQANVVEGIALYKATMQKELSHLNEASEQTFEFSAITHDSSSDSPQESEPVASPSTPELLPATQRSPDSIFFTEKKHQHGFSMTRSRIVISSASKAKVRTPQKSAVHQNSPQKTYFETESDGDY